jgi:SAM-dependent methyltransferase
VQISKLFDREESERHPPFGRLLDLGCGTGIWSVKMAKRGWDVTGVDIARKAVSAANERARRETVVIKFIQGDVAALSALGVGSGFSLILDLGTIHGLSQGQRESVGREVNAIAASDATMLILSWVPGFRGPLPHGASGQEIQAAFPEWRLVSDEGADVSGAPRFIKKAEPHFYRLRRS